MKSVVPAIQDALPAVKAAVSGVANDIARVIQAPAETLNTLRTGLNNPITTRGGILGTPQTANSVGSLRIVGSGFSESEVRTAQVLSGQGRDVVLREASGIRRMSDLLVDGVPYDVYTPTTGNFDRIVSSIASKGSQVNGGGVVLDLSQSPLTGVDAGELLARVRGVTSNVSDIIVLGG